MKYKVLKLLTEMDDYVSGQELANLFGVTRTAIWKVIGKLKEEGYTISSISNRGHRLTKNLDIDFLNEFEIEKGLKTETIGKNVVFLKEIYSTNEELKNIISKNKNDDFDINTILISAKKQKSGRGRHSKIWFSEEENSLCFSFSIKPDISPFEVQSITLLVGIAICRVLRNLTKKDVLVKWPNDIVINNKKVAGALTEISAEMEKINFAIIGIGLNVNNVSFPNDIKDKASSIFLETGVRLRRATIIQEILFEFEKIYEEFLNIGSFEPFLDEYKSICVNMDKDVKVIYNKKEIFGKVVDISSQGNIVIRNSENNNLDIFSGEVSIRNENGEYI